MKTKRISSIAGILVFLLLIVPQAFADEYRLKEAVTNSEHVLYSYDQTGSLIRETYSDGVEEVYEYIDYFYGDDHRLTDKTISFPDGFGSLCFHYDSNKTQIEMENPGMGGDYYVLNGETPRELRDKSGKITMAVFSSAYPTEYYYSYDETGRISVFEISGYRKDCFEYKSDGTFTRTSIYNADNKAIITEKYDENGRLIESRDQYGFINNFYYDDNGLLVSKYCDGALEYSCQYTYDANGNLSSMTRFLPGNAVIVTEYKYEKA